MRAQSLFLLAAATAVVGLGGCKRADWSPLGNAGHQGRYVGVGIYGPNKQWTRMAATQASGADSHAQPIDDQVVIVVADSQTGELRACGDLTGYCIGMNPWAKPLVTSQVAPIVLTQHVTPDEPDMTVMVSSEPRKPHR
jgi:hypothetical protein